VNKILTIAQITVKRELRNKMIYILLAIAFLLIFMARGCPAGKINIEKTFLRPEQIINMGIAIAFNIILFWGLSLCGLLAMNTLSRELSEETVVLTVTKPIKRSWFLMGKFLAVLFIVFINLMVLNIGFLLLLYFRTGVVTLSIFSGLTVAFLNFILIISLIFLFSLFFPRVISALLAFTIYAISFGLSIPFSFEKIRAYWEPSFSSQLLHYLLPQLGGVHLYAASFISSYFPSSIGFWSIIDVVGYIIVVWLVMVFIFQRKAI
jgi:ABC-type transport system involved in multi-copper enzyme maturation permease subunit